MEKFDNDVKSLNDFKTKANEYFGVNWKFNLEVYISSLPKEQLHEKCFTNEVKELINALSFTYNLNTLDMQGLVRNAINEKGLIDKTLLRKSCRDYYQFDNNGNLPTLIYNKQPDYLKKPQGDNSKWAKMVYTFENLTANTEYMYQIRAIVNKDCLSETSNIIYVKTNSTPISTDIENNFTQSLYTINNTLYIEGLNENSEVTIYNISGIKIYQTTLNSQSTLNIQLPKGIYIAQINNNQHIKTIKFIIK